MSRECRREKYGAEGRLATIGLIACVDRVFVRLRICFVPRDVLQKVLNEARRGDGWSP